MTPAIDETKPFRIERPYHGLSRVLMAGAGLLCIVMPAWEFRFALREIGWWTLFFGTIVAGAWSVGIPFLISSVFGDSETWTFREGELHVERSSPWRGRRSEVVGSSDVAHIEIRTIEWDSRPDSYSVMLHLRSSGRLETPDYGTFAKAKAIRAEIRQRLRMDQGD
jgi:hypothetical protein